MTPVRVAIGVRVKTARATAVIVGGSRREPRALLRRELTLYDPAVPHSGQPYHVALELGEERAAPLVARALEAVRSVSRRELRSLVESLKGDGHAPASVGFVVGSLGDPAKLGNPHVRAHALEGRLYWQALEAAAEELGLACNVLTEKEAYGHASKSLGVKSDHLRATLAELGRALGRPWGAEEKTAALAAWSAL